MSADQPDRGDPSEPHRGSADGDTVELPVVTLGPDEAPDDADTAEGPDSTDSSADTADRPPPSAADASRANPAGNSEPDAGAAPTDEQPHRRFARRARGVAGSGLAGLSRAGQRGAHTVSRLAGAQGMRESGLSRLFALHVFNAGGDAAIAVGLAGTLFFQVPSGEARGRVALYLLLTMAPFALVAPLLGPFLDRFRHGRRWAIGSTMAARAFFCWVLAGAISTGSTWLYPVAFGCLVASKAYGIARSASVPRVLPEKVALVTANSRISLSGVVGAAIGGGVAAAASRIGPGWALRWGFAVFIGATILAIRLPARIDSTEGESGSKLMLGLLGRTRRHLPREVLAALQINTALRAFSGFLLVFLAFLLRDHPFAGVPHLLMYAMVGAAAGGGSMLGTGLGAVLRARPPRMIVRAVLVLAIAGAVAGALFFGPVFAVVSALIGGLCQQLGKLSLDATIQKQVSDDWRTSVFARSETMLQIGWVLGGVLGIVVPLWAWLGFTCAAVWMAGAGAWVLASRLRHHGGSVIASA